MHVMEQGKGRPVLLFHGNPTWGYLYRRVAAELTGESVRLIMPDLVGLGLSDRPEAASDHTLLNHSRWAASLLGRLDLEDAIVVVQDWGGPIGMHAVMQHEGLMSGLVVMNTSIDAPKEGFNGTRFHRVIGSPLGGMIPWYRALSFAQGDKGSVRGVVQRSYNYPLSRRRGNDAARALVLMIPDTMDHESVGPLGHIGDFVRSFDGPSAIVWGDRDPVLGRLRRRHERMLPEATVTATDAGHFLQEEVPEAIAAAVRDVVSRS